MESLHTPLQTIAAWVLLPSLLGLLVALAWESVRPRKHFWTGQAWLDRIGNTTQEEQA